MANGLIRPAAFIAIKMKIIMYCFSDIMTDVLETAQLMCVCALNVHSHTGLYYAVHHVM